MVFNINEAADKEYLAVSNKTKNFILYGKHVDIIKTKVNELCKDLYTGKYKENIKKQPSFGKIAKMDGYATIVLKGISSDEYSSGYGLDFQSAVASKLNKVKDLKRYSFEVEDYPGILINCHVHSIKESTEEEDNDTLLEGGRTKYIDRLADENDKLEAMKGMASSGEKIKSLDKKIRENNVKAAKYGQLEDKFGVITNPKEDRWGDNRGKLSAREISNDLHSKKNHDKSVSKIPIWGKKNYDDWSKTGKNKFKGPQPEDKLANKQPGSVLKAQKDINAIKSGKKKAIKEACLNILAALDDIEE